MRSIALDVLDALESRPELTAEQKRALLAGVPQQQWSVPGGHFDDLAQHCCNRVEIRREPRFMNRLSINVMPPRPRCLFRSPDGRGLAWLKSGGELEAYGRCEQDHCEHAKPAAAS